MKIPQTCPRCGGWIPNNHQPGAYPGALSRRDNSTEICSECGTIEALLGLAGVDLTDDKWVVEIVS